ncbi:hypothetical protein ACFLZZ_01835 [Nanoarchaeota archaeon]
MLGNNKKKGLYKLAKERSKKANEEVEKEEKKKKRYVSGTHFGNGFGMAYSFQTEEEMDEIKKERESKAAKEYQKPTPRPATAHELYQRMTPQERAWEDYLFDVGEQEG